MAENVGVGWGQKKEKLGNRSHSSGKKKVKDKRIGKWITLFINKQSKLKQDCFP